MARTLRAFVPPHKTWRAASALNLSQSAQGKQMVLPSLRQTDALVRAFDIDSICNKIKFNYRYFTRTRVLLQAHTYTPHICSRFGAPHRRPHAVKCMPSQFSRAEKISNKLIADECFVFTRMNPYGAGRPELLITRHRWT